MTKEIIQTNLFSNAGETEEVGVCYSRYDLGPGIKAFEVTCQSCVEQYNPVVGYKLSRALRENEKMLHSAKDNAEAQVEKAFREILEEKLREDTVVFFPFYYSNDVYGDTMERKHQNTFTDIMASIKNLEGEIPRVLCIMPDSGKSAGEDLLYRNFQEESSVEKGFLVTKSSDHKRLMGLSEEALSAKDFKYIAEALGAWLEEHPEIKNIVFPDMMTVKHLFKDNKKLKTLSFARAVYRVFNAEGPGRRPYRVSFITSHNNHRKYDEKVYGITADILSILMNPGTEPEIKYEYVEDVAHAKQIIKDVLKRDATLSLDLETTGLNPVYPDQRIISCAVSDGKTGWGFLVDHPFERDPRYDGGKGMEILKTFAYDKRLRLVMQNAVYDCKWLKHFFGKFPEADIRDTMLYDHWLFETQGMISKFLGIGYGYSMDAQIPRYLRIPSHKEMLDAELSKIIPLNSTIESNCIAKGKDGLLKFIPDHIRLFLERMHSPDWREPGSGQYARLPLDILMDYNRRDAVYTMRIYKRQMQMIISQLGGKKAPFVFKHIFPALIRNTVEMQLNGMPIDYDLLEMKLRVIDSELHKIRTILEAVQDSKGNDFEYDSEKKIMAFLKSRYSLKDDDFWDEVTDKVCLKDKILKDLMDDNERPLIKHIRDYRKLMKVRNTYLLPFLFSSYRGRLYFDLDLTGTSTGRFSARNPNIQNIMKKLETTNLVMGVKEVLTAEQGMLLMDMDLSSAEIKVLPTACPDETLIKTLKDGLDAHSNTASLLLGRTYEEVRDAVLKDAEKGYTHLTEREKENVDMRQSAKRVNFGAIYRIGPMGLSSQIVVKNHEINYGKETNRKQRKIIKQKTAYKKAESMLAGLFKKVFPRLEPVFADCDKEVLEKGYGESIFGRRRHYTYTPVPRIFEIIKKAGLYGEDAFDVEDVLKLISSKRPFRQNMNYKVQSATSDYMVMFIDYIRRKAAENGVFLKLHITVHDSVVMSYSGKPDDYDDIRRICDEGMNIYLMSLSDKLPVPIGYDIAVTERYCQIQK